MFPSAVGGKLPFVDEYKQEQINKVLEKHRARHHSGPDSQRSAEKAAKHRNTHSMPSLWHSVYAGQRPRFISMPTLDDNCLNYGAASTRHSVSQCSSSSQSKPHKHSLLSSLKKLFNKKEDNKPVTSSKMYARGFSGAIVEGNSSRPYGPSGKNKKNIDSDVLVTSGVRSPKRQRMRTISNISGVMETIEEVNEVLASTDHLSSCDTESSDSLSEITYRSVASAPEFGGSNSVLYSCSNLSSFSDSSSSLHGSSDMICVS